MVFKNRISCILLAGLLCGTVSESNASDMTDTTESSTQLGHLLFTADNLLSVEQGQISLDRYLTDVYHDKFMFQETWQITTAINHLAPDTTLQFLASDKDVWVYIQYFTDIDGDGNYEWIVNYTGKPYLEVVSRNNEIVAEEKISSWQKLKADQMRSLDVMTLLQRGLEAEQSRDQESELTPLNGLDYVNQADIIYCISFSDQDLHASKTNFQPDSLPSYYLTIDLEGWSDPKVTGAFTFSDVGLFDWYFEGVHFCVQEGLFSGATATEFNPQGTFTRAMAIQTLYNMAGSPDYTPRSFVDVGEKAWFATAFEWAVKNNVIKMEVGGYLRPTEAITREELLSVLYQFAQLDDSISTKYENTASSFPDYKKVNSQYNQAVNWAFYYGLVSGNTEGNLQPEATATRGQAAVILNNFLQLRNP